MAHANPLIVAPFLIPQYLADPGTAEVIPVDRSYDIPLTIGSAGAETNTLAVPTVVGQRLKLRAVTVGTGTRVVTVAGGVNKAGKTTMTFAAADDFIELGAMPTSSSALVWRVISNDGVTLGP